MFLTIIGFILILQLLVFVHELGHFLTARRAGVNVEEFGFGLPPRIFGFVKNGVLYSLNWLPLGGFVRMKGEESESGDTDSFSQKPLLSRFIILSAGVFMNFLLAVVCYSIVFMIGFPMNAERLSAEPGNGSITERYLIVSGVLDDGPAKDSELEVGDKIVRLNGAPISTLSNAQAAIAENATITLFVNKRGQEISYVLEPRVIEDVDPDRPILGLGLEEIAVVRYNPFVSVWKGLKESLYIIGRIVVVLGTILRDLVTTRTVTSDVGGPVAIAVFTGRVIDLGISHVLQFIAVISLNFTVINFLPFPALDGGRALFLAIEKFRGKSVSQKIEGMTHQIGFMLLMLLFVLITVRDVARFEIVDWIKSLF